MTKVSRPDEENSAAASGPRMNEKYLPGGRHMLKYAATVLAVSLMLVSCLGVEQVISLNRDNSGSISFTYRIARELTDLGSYGDAKKGLPFPVHRADFERTIAGNAGLVLSSYSQTENQKDVVIRASVTFSSLEALSGLAMPGDTIATARTNGNLTTLSVTIPSLGDAEIDEETIEMLRDMYAGYELVFTVRTPKNIIESSIGEIARDRRSATFRTTVYDLASAPEKLIFTIKW
jgi:hypothetical protein